MNYQIVDHDFKRWVKDAGLPLFTEYKGEEVRSTEIIDNNKTKWQLWLVPVEKEGECVIHYWNYKDISRHSKVLNSLLFQELVSIENKIKTGRVKPRHLP